MECIKLGLIISTQYRAFHFTGFDGPVMMSIWECLQDCPQMHLMAADNDNGVTIARVFQNTVLRTEKVLERVQHKTFIINNGIA